MTKIIIIIITIIDFLILINFLKFIIKIILIAIKRIGTFTIGKIRIIIIKAQDQQLNPSLVPLI